METKLKKLNMKLSKEHNHPDIKADDETPYLIKHDGQYFVGTFNMEWFGLNFDGWHAPLQFDEPNTNRSGWEQIWEIIEV